MASRACTVCDGLRLLFTLVAALILAGPCLVLGQEQLPASTYVRPLGGGIQGQLPGAGGQERLTGADLRDLIETVRLLPPEFKADLLMRLVESGAVPGHGAAQETAQETAQDLLEEAFFAASVAQEPVRLDLGGWTGRPAGTREVARARAFQWPLDGLTLQSRALRLMVLLDPVRAWALEPFVQLALPPLTCADALTFNVEATYRNLEEFVARLPDADRFLVLQRYVSSMSSALQVAPTAEILTRVPMPEGERSLLIRDFAFELDRLTDADRAFSAALERERFPQRIVELAEISLQHGDDPGFLVDAFRTFLTRHFRARRCSDVHEGPDLNATQWFNGDLLAMTTMNMQPIDYDQFGGHRVERGAVTHDIEHPPEFATLAREIVATLGPVPRGRPEGMIALTPFLKTPEGVVGDVLVWHGAGMRSIGDFVLDKAALLESLLRYLSPESGYASRRGGSTRAVRPALAGASPSGPQPRQRREVAAPEPWNRRGLEAAPQLMDRPRDIVVGELITLVAASAPLLDDPLVWFSHVARLLDYAREADPLERDRILTAFEGSGNQVMASYAALERLR